MNDQSPLIPQGSLLEQKNKKRVRFKIAVIFVLALHGIGLFALLMQGCGNDKSTSGSTASNAPPSSTYESAQTNPAPPFAPPSNAAPESAATTTSAQPPTAASPASNPYLPPSVPETSAAPAAPTATAGGTEYKIVRGDMLWKIAKNHHVSLQALQSLNPGVDSTKLKIGQTIHIPASASAPAPSGGSAAAGAGTETPGGQQTYTVKSNDSLSKIARQFGVKVKALRAANNLRSDRIKVGDKLKIPPKTASSASGASTPAGNTSNAVPGGPSGR